MPRASLSPIAASPVAGRAGGFAALPLPLPLPLPQVRLRSRLRGFTLIELMAVIAVVAILAMIALPSIQGRLVREQIVEAAKIADIAKPPIALAWALTHLLPADNAAAGLPAADKIVGNHVDAVTIENGAIHIRFGNRANSALRGKTLSLRPAVVEDAPIVPVAWVCGNASVPDKMSVKGPNRTDVAEGFLPLNCR
ncbi:MAG: pilin [Burkholderiaceae bacterium]